jgi:hypothetical protein
MHTGPAMSGLLHPATYPDGVVVYFLWVAITTALAFVIRRVPRTRRDRGQARAVPSLREGVPASATEERWLFGRGKALRDELVALPDGARFSVGLVLRVVGLSRDARAFYERHVEQVDASLILDENDEQLLLTVSLRKESLQRIVSAHLAAIRSVIHAPSPEPGDDRALVRFLLTPSATEP